MNHLRKVALLGLIIFITSSGLFIKTEPSEALTVLEQSEVLLGKPQYQLTHKEVNDCLIKRGNLEVFCSKYGIQYYKRTKYYNYLAVLTDVDPVLIVFNHRGVCFFYWNIRYSDNECEDKLADIGIGDSVENVRAIDPHGDYSIFYASSSDFPQISYHFFENGHCYEIEYIDRIVQYIEMITL